MKTQSEASTTTEAAAVAEQGAQVASESKPSTKGAKTAKKPASAKAAKKQTRATSKKASKPAEGQPREGGKKQIVLDMLRRKDGATLENIMKTTGWQKHSVRGFISIVTKKMDLPIASLKNDKGDRCYRIEK